MEFQSTIAQSGGATGIETPQDVMAFLGGGKRYPVVVTIGEYTYRSTVTWYKGTYMIPLSAEHRKAAGVAGGDKVTVDVVLDEAPREVPLPDDLDAAIDDDARAFYASLSPSRKKAFTVWIEDAKKPETRAKRVATAAQMLREHKKR